jgi:carbamate kinase
MGYGTAEETFLDDLSVEEARALVKQGQLSAATTLPKLEAAVNFVSAAPGRKAVITCLDKALDAMKGRTGTLIHE